MAGVEKREWIGEASPPVEPVEWADADAEVEMRRQSLTGAPRTGDKFVAFDPLARFDGNFADQGIETLSPAMFEFDVTLEAAGLEADFDDATVVDGKEVTARFQPEVDADVAFEGDAVVAILGIVVRVLAEELEHGRGGVERGTEIDAFRLVETGDQRLGQELVFHGAMADSPADNRTRGCRQPADLTPSWVAPNARQEFDN